MKIGDRVKLISVPKCFPDDLNREGVVVEIGLDTIHGRNVDILLDGDEGLSAVFDYQLMVLKEDACMKDYRNTIWKSLTDECHMRLCECRSTKEDIPKLVNSVWTWWKENGEGYTKEDAVIYILELLEANSQWELADLIDDEYNDLCK